MTARGWKTTMKTIPPIFLSLILALAVSTKEATAGFQWQLIAEITDFETHIIANASRKPAERALSKATSFFVSRGTVALLFKNGTIGFYGYSEEFTPATTEERRTQDPSWLMDNETYNPRTELDKIIDKFINTWDKYQDANPPDSKKLLEEADTLFQKYLLTASIETDPPRASYFAMHGNRYLNELTP